MSEIEVQQSGRVVTVTMNRQPVNALTSALYEEMGEIFLKFVSRDDINCVIIASGSKKTFCAGKDLKEFLGATVEDDPRQAYIVRRAFEAIRHCPVPVIAQVNGPALGAGCVIAAVADIRVASEKATFGLPEVNVGRCGGAAHIGRLIPQGALRRMYFTAEPISAAEAYRLGLVDVLVAPEALEETVQAMAAKIATKSPIGLRIGKKSMNEAEEMAIDVGYAREQSYSTMLMRTEDAREATLSLVEKRPPVFVGR